MSVPVIVVEDGTGLANADSYVSQAFVVAYALQRGVTFPSDVTGIPYLVKAMDYIESNAYNFVGEPSTTTQALSFPRMWPVTSPLLTNSYSINAPFGAYGVLTVLPQIPTLVANEVPLPIQNAQAALAILSFQGNDLMPSDNGQFVLVEKVGPLQTNYSERLSSSTPSFPVVEALINPYLGNNGPLQLQSRRA